MNIKIGQKYLATYRGTNTYSKGKVTYQRWSDGPSEQGRIDLVDELFEICETQIDEEMPEDSLYIGYSSRLNITDGFYLGELKSFIIYNKLWNDICSQ